MSKVSKKLRAAIDVHAAEQKLWIDIDNKTADLLSRNLGFKYKPGDDFTRISISHLCNSIEEVNAVSLCQAIMEGAAPQYDYMRAPYIKNTNRNRKHFESAMAKAKNPEDQSTEISYMLQLEPISPQAQKLKDDATDQVKLILKDAGIGKDRMIKILPYLVAVLGNSVEPLTDEEVRAADEYIKHFLK